jgi:hypothetical protein
MQIVGSLIWMSSVRLDIVFALMYLTWFTKKPRVHLMTMAYYLMSYLYYSKDIPLVLGGKDKLKILGYCDSSWGTGPKGRSICGVMVKLGQLAGCITAKSTASGTTVRMSSFESELEKGTLAMKTIRRVANIIDEMRFIMEDKPELYNDNTAMIDFVKGDGEAKGVRHMELRMWYIREQYAMGNIDMHYMEGTILPADRLTKPSTKPQHIEFRIVAMGLRLL